MRRIIVWRILSSSKPPSINCHSVLTRLLAEDYKGTYMYTCQDSIDPFMIFSTFDKNQLTKISQHGWKECLKTGKLAKSEKDLLKFNEDIVPIKVQNFTNVICMVEGKFVSPSPHYTTSVKFYDLVEQYLCSHWTYHLQTWTVTF